MYSAITVLFAIGLVLLILAGYLSLRPVENDYLFLLPGALGLGLIALSFLIWVISLAIKLGGID